MLGPVSVAELIFTIFEWLCSNWGGASLSCARPSVIPMWLSSSDHYVQARSRSLKIYSTVHIVQSVGPGSYVFTCGIYHVSQILGFGTKTLSVRISLKILINVLLSFIRSCLANTICDQGWLLCWTPFPATITVNGTSRISSQGMTFLWWSNVAFCRRCSNNSKRVIGKAPFQRQLCDHLTKMLASYPLGCVP